MKNLAIYLASTALGAGLMFSCSTTAIRVAEKSASGVREPASAVSCGVPPNKGLPRLHAKDPNYSYCSQFIDSGCRLGDFGEIIRELFVPTGLDEYVRRPPSDVATYCPNYARFDTDTRQRFWIFTLMALAYEESGCGEPSVVQAVRNYYQKYKGTKSASLSAAEGAFALPYYEKDRGYRSDFCKDARIEADANSLREMVFPGETGTPVYLGPSKIAGMTANTRCTMAMLAKQIKKDGALVHRRSYWQKLVRPGSLTTRLRTFGHCTGKYESRPIEVERFGSEVQAIHEQVSPVVSPEDTSHDADSDIRPGSTDQ